MKLTPATTTQFPGMPMDRPLLLIGERYPELGPGTVKALFKQPPAK